MKRWTCRKHTSALSTVWQASPGENTVLMLSLLPTNDLLQCKTSNERECNNQAYRTGPNSRCYGWRYVRIPYVLRQCLGLAFKSPHHTAYVFWSVFICSTDGGLSRALRDVHSALQMYPAPDFWLLSHLFWPPSIWSLFDSAHCPLPPVLHAKLAESRDNSLLIFIFLIVHRKVQLGFSRENHIN